MTGTLGESPRHGQRARGQRVHLGHEDHDGGVGLHVDGLAQTAEFVRSRTLSTSATRL